MLLIRLGMLCLALGAATSAVAAEVVWLDGVPAADVEARVAEAAGAAGPSLRPLDLRAGAAAWSAADDAAYATLEKTLRDVRMFETRLDGELLIMRDLERPIAAVTILRDDADRDALFAALAYQGFAVDRFFMDKLGGDERAEPYRMDLSGISVERPWVDAVALDPDRAVTPYDIAEAPQRIAYEEVREQVRAALPGEIRVEGLPEGAVVVIDGHRPSPGPTGGYRVTAGRHLVHLDLDGTVLARWDVRVDAAGLAKLAPPVSDEAWDAFLAAVRAGGQPEVPAGLGPAVEALGGEVWLARVDERGNPQVARLGAAGVEEVDLPRMSTPSRSSEGRSGLSVAGGVGGGWLYSGDFYTQDPSNPHTTATVNAGALHVLAEVAWDIGIVRLGAGADVGFTLGSNHVALTGDTSTRVRPAAYAAAGIRWVQVTGGYLFPYHPFVGGHASVPLWQGLEARAGCYYGFRGTLKRDSGTSYDTQELWGANAGLAWRFRL